MKRGGTTTPPRGTNVALRTARGRSPASQRWLKQGFNASHATQILQNLAEKGFVYKNRRAGYCFAIPLLREFIRRQPWDPSRLRNQET